MNITIKMLKSAHTIDDLLDLNIGEVRYEIATRGGYISFVGSQIAQIFDIPPSQLTNNVGAYVNYLGGGVRGSIRVSEFSRVENKRKARLVEELLEACRRAYKNAEDEMEMNLEYNDNGETDWDAMATNAARAQGIHRAY